VAYLQLPRCCYASYHSRSTRTNQYHYCTTVIRLVCITYDIMKYCVGGSTN
jgi:hypothetical protein